MLKLKRKKMRNSKCCYDKKNLTINESQRYFSCKGDLDFRHSTQLGNR